MTERTVFLASLAPMASAIKVHGTDGGRVTLDVPDEYMAEMLRLVAMRERVLRVEISVDEASPRD